MFRIKRWSVLPHLVEKIENIKNLFERGLSLQAFILKRTSTKYSSNQKHNIFSWNIMSRLSFSLGSC